MERNIIPEEFCWGWKTPVIHKRRYIIDILKIKQGGFSSIHYHNYQSNLMYVVSGHLFISFPGENRVAKHLFEGMWIKIFPPEQHQFRALKDCVVIEFIQSTSIFRKVFRQDIVRLTERGISNAGINSK